MKNSSVKLVTLMPVTHKVNTLLAKKVYSPNAITVEVPLKTPVLAFLSIGEQTSAVYLTPGEDLTVSLSTENPTRFSYSGLGAKPNFYLQSSTDIWNRFQAQQANLMEQPVQQFLSRLDSFQLAIDAFHDYYTDSLQLNKSVASLLHARHLLKLIDLKQQYKLIHQEDSTITITTTALANLSSSIPFDSSYLQMQMFEYGLVLDLYLQSDIYLAVSRQLKQKQLDEQQKLLPVFSALAIQKRQYPAGIREVLLAKNLANWLAWQGLIPVVDSMYQAFNQQYPTSAFNSELREEYNQWVALSSGHVAPPITGMTPSGKKLSIQDLKGKVVYVDVWATWCGPCLAEFPSSKQLQQEFKENDQVVFVYLSVDQDRLKWLTYLKKNNFQGIHIIDSSQEGSSAVMQTYKIASIPRYIIIDKQGKIVDANAARPSSGKVSQQIKQALNKVS